MTGAALLDAAVQLLGPEFDQPCLHYYSAPMSPDHRGPVMGLQTRIHRWDNMMREFTHLARRYEVQAGSALSQGHEVTAREIASSQRRSCMAQRNGRCSSTPT